MNGLLCNDSVLLDPGAPTRPAGTLEPPAQGPRPGPAPDRTCLLLSAVLALVLAAPLPAATPQVWFKGTQSAFGASRFEHLSLTDQGEVMLAPAPRRLFDGKGETFIWSLALSPTGQLYCGTAPHGRVYRQLEPERWEVALETGEVAVTAMAFGPDGTLYAATIPGGLIHRLSAGKPVKPALSTGQRYVWSMLADPRGGLVVATGRSARVLRIDPALPRKPTVLLESDEAHILCLAIEEDGSILAGSAGHGLLYRVPPKGPAAVLFDAPQEEVRAVVRDGSTLYVAAQTGLRTFPSSRNQPSLAASSTALSGAPARSPSGSFAARVTTAMQPSAVRRLLTPRLQAAIGVVSRPAAAQTTAAQAKTVGDSGAAKPAPSLPAKAEPMPPAPTPSRHAPKFGRTGNSNQAVFAVRPGLAAIQVFSSDQEVLLSLAADAGGGAIVGTGNNGVLFRIARDGTLTRWLQLEEAQVLCLLERGQGEFLVGTGNPGRVYRLSPDRVSEGVLTTEVLDAGQVAEWGRLSWVFRGPGSLTLATRSGGGEKPDSTWSPWSPAGAQPGERTPATPPARYLQLRARLSGVPGSRGPVLESLRLVYQPMNAPPSIDSMEVTTPFVEAYSEHKEPSLKERDRQQELQKKRPPSFVRRVRWEASDPDKDRLAAMLSYRGEGETDWKPLLSEPTVASEYDWDTRQLPDGTYRLQLAVTDAWSNPPAAAATATRLSEPFVVDNTPPQMTPLAILADGPSSVTVTAVATDGSSNVWTFEYALDTAPWVPLAVADGLGDSRSESVRLRLGGLSRGEHTLAVRARDELGNVAASKVTFHAK